MTAFHAANRVDVPIRSPISEGSVCIWNWNSASSSERVGEVEFLRLGPERRRQRREKIVTIDLKRVLVGPEALHDLETRIAAIATGS